MVDHAGLYLFKCNGLPTLVAPQQNLIPIYPPPAPSPHHQPQQEFHPSPSPPLFSIETTFNELNLNMNTRFDALERRFEAEHKDNSRALWPTYADYYACDCVSPETIHPTWFTAPTSPPVYNYTKEGFFDTSAPDGSAIYYPPIYY